MAWMSSAARAGTASPLCTPLQARSPLLAPHVAPNASMTPPQSRTGWPFRSPLPPAWRGATARGRAGPSGQASQTRASGPMPRRRRSRRAPARACLGLRLGWKSFGTPRSQHACGSPTKGCGPRPEEAAPPRVTSCWMFAWWWCGAQSPRTMGRAPSSLQRERPSMSSSSVTCRAPCKRARMAAVHVRVGARVKDRPTVTTRREF